MGASRPTTVTSSAASAAAKAPQPPDPLRQLRPAIRPELLPHRVPPGSVSPALRRRTAPRRPFRCEPSASPPKNRASELSIRATYRARSHQERVLRCIRQAIADRGEAPTVREIGDAVGMSRRSSVHYQLVELETKQAIVREPGRARGIRLA
ncbi:LexA family protein [Streptomyces echinatus]|uniref:LexA family protein n=1 Tax=Streptomyces echinatus TaxID=67293 RepID=UPI003791BE97